MNDDADRALPIAELESDLEARPDALSSKCRIAYPRRSVPAAVRAHARAFRVLLSPSKAEAYAVALAIRPARANVA